MRCGRARSARRPKLKAIGDKGKGYQGYLAFSLRRSKRQQRLGMLGEAIPAASNSARAGAQHMKVHKKNNKKNKSKWHRGRYHTPKGGEPSLGSSTKLSPDHFRSSSSIQNVLQGSPTGCSSRAVIVGAPGDAMSSTRENSDHVQPPPIVHKGGTHGIDAFKLQRPAKRARLLKSVSTFVCVGKCPSTWTMDSYCESCHG